MTGDSRTDLEALRRSGSGKILALAVVLLGALGAAAWFLFFQPQGIGAPEEADKVLVVRSGEVAGYSAVLDRGGFDAAEGKLEHWVDKARTELPEMPEGTDVQVVIALADHFGYGFVAFERPEEVDFSGLDIEAIPPFEDHVRFAVLSVGDFAFPHVMTVNPEPSKALRRPDISLLQALFEQEPLKEALPDNEAASVDAIQLRSRLEEALTDLELVELADALAREVMGEADRALQDERAEAKPIRLSESLESGNPVPVPGGGVLVASRAYGVVTDNGIQAELSADPEELLWFSATPGTTGRVRCEAVLGGTISSLESPKFAFADDGGALLVETLAQGSQLWTAAGQGPCGYVLKGKVPDTSLDAAQLLLPHRSGKVARVGTVLGEATVEVVDVAQPDAPPRHVELTGVAVRDVAWLDDAHLAATGDDGLLYLLSVDPQASVLATALQGLGRDPTLYEVTRLSDSAVALTVGSSPRRVVAVDAGRSWVDLFAAPPTLPPPASEDVLSEEAPVPAVLRLDPSGFSATTLTRAGKATEIVGAPDGTSVVFSLHDRTLDDPGKGDDTEIAIAAVDGGGLRLLTRNTLRDHSPAFTADGAWVVFETRLDLPRSSWRVTVPRAVPVR